MRKKVIKKMKQSNSTLIGTFLIGITLLLLGLGFGGYDYLQVQGLIAESKQLSNVGKYKEALSKLEIAQIKWSSATAKKEIQQEIHTNTDLEKSSDNFEQGKIQYDGENYEKAIEYFDRVINTDENYKTAQSYKDLAEKKITQDYKSNTQLQVSSQQVMISQTPKLVDNLSALCESDIEKFKADERIKWNNLLVETLNKQGGREVLAAQGKYFQAQHDAWIDLVASSKKQYCLEHNRDYNGFVAPIVNIASP